MSYVDNLRMHLAEAETKIIQLKALNDDLMTICRQHDLIIEENGVLHYWNDTSYEPFPNQPKETDDD